MRTTMFPILRTTLRLPATALLLGLTLLLTQTANSAEDAVANPPGSIEFVGENAIATANGVFHQWRIVEQSEPGTPLAERYAVVEIDLESVDTGINRRDDHLRDPDFFEVTRWPMATVKAHSLRAEEGVAGRFTARFDIDLHGVQKTLEGEVVVESESPLVLTGALVVDRLAFDVGPPTSRWNPMAVDAEIPVRFRIEL